MILFSTIAFGWLARDGVSIERRIIMEIAFPFMVYYFALILRSIGYKVMALDRMGLTSYPAAWLVTALAWLQSPLWIWYAYQMLKRGRELDLPSKYGSVLYTIWVSLMSYSFLSYLVEVVFYGIRTGWQDLTVPLARMPKIIGPTLKVFSLPFAIICYAYLNSKYGNRRYLQTPNDKE